MGIQMFAFVVPLLLFQGAVLSFAAPKSSGSLAFDEWLKTFDPATAVASSRLINCLDKLDGFYPGADPDTCSATYTACISGVAFPQTCDSGEVFDSTVRKCVNRYTALSDACENYPTPTCTADNLNEYLPTKRCGDIYYLCLTAGGAPIFVTCDPGLPTHYFDPIEFCRSVVGSICEPPPPTDPPIQIPDYGCGSDKITGFAYAISECSVSFYTCDRTITTNPIPNSCNIIGDAGTVFDYKAPPAVPSPGSCIKRSDVLECTP